tara:strand:+ start:2064 stop:2558 length:495 start_codon:yes stop_codon:yes gene_type:complete
MTTNNDDETFDCGHDECEDEDLKVLYLTRDEVLYIDDRLTMMIEKDGRADNFSTVVPIVASAGLPAPVDLLDKVGMAVLVATEEDYDNELVSVPVTATDLYMLREIAKSNIKLNGKYVGLSLKRKIYGLLFEEEHKADRTFKRLLSDVNLEGETSNLDWSGESG